MPDGHDQIEISVIERLADIPLDQWNACAGSDNPFLRYEFLSALEDSACVQASTGWVPRHVLIKSDDGSLLACAPMYLKGHSMGEYVFDWGWAEAYERAGGNYYPKLISAVPFTPVTGPRLMVRSDLSQTMSATLKRQLAETMAGSASAANLSSLHVNFIPDEDVAVFAQCGYLSRTGLQYHWRNQGYASYDDFLGELSSRKRKALKKERRAALQDGAITIEHIAGDDIRAEHWDALYAFYMDTGARKWGRPYLNRDFFALLGERLSERVVLIFARKDGDIIAGALNLLGEEALYGRYWGCKEDVRFLHFELCYHQAIDIAIERGLSRVEAGAQGEHKIARGYLPVLTHSAHFIPDPSFRRGVSDFLEHERRSLEQEREVLLEESPYRKG